MKVAAALAAAVSLAGCRVGYDAALLSSIEGRWMCDVQRYAFADPEDIVADLEGRLAGNGVSVEAYRAFKDDLPKRAELREQVAAEYGAYCDIGG